MATVIKAAAACAVGCIICFGSHAFAQQQSARPPFVTPAPPFVSAPTQAVSAYAGSDFVEDAFYAFSGARVAVNGDLSRPGFIADAVLGIGGYDYINEDVRGGVVDATTVDIVLTVGYQGLLSKNLGWSAGIGVHVQNTELQPNDPSNEDRGTHEGFAVNAQVEVRDAKPFFWGLQGDYSTVFDSYYSRARIGYNFDKVLVGPEGVFFGTETQHTQRVGGFVTFPLRLTSNFVTSIAISSGYQFVNTSDDDGGTGGIGGSQNSWYITSAAGWSF